MIEKSEIRKQYARQRKEITGQIRIEKEQKLRRFLLESELFSNAQCLYTYVSYDTEADTKEIISIALQEGKRVFVPKVYEKRRMEFFEIHSMDELKPGFHGILEPEALEEKENIYLKESVFGEKTGVFEDGICLMLLPGIAFDTFGNRLGYGGGYYDTYLARFPKDFFYKLGMGFECQLCERADWLVDRTDIPVDGILTEVGFVNGGNLS